jgi:hypothetical protein
MTTIPPNMPFTYKSSCVYPGAYLINGGNGSFPIFCSITNYDTFGMNDIDNHYIVMPGYKLDTFTSTAYTGTANGTFDNRAGTVPMYYSFSSSTDDSSSSCKLYFGYDTNNEIKITGISS